MYKFEHSILINRPPQEVFDFVTNPANAHLWQTGVESAEWTSEDPKDVGSTWRIVMKFLGRKIEADLEILSWDPPNQMSSKTVSGPIPYQARFRFEPKDGGTQLSMQNQGEFGGFFKLAEGLVGKQVEKQVESDSAALKLLLESG